MRVEPASISQIQTGLGGRMVEISADAGGVAEGLRRLDPCLKVRFAENASPPCWIVFWESPDGRDSYLVTSRTAYQTNTGVWTGLDQRVVKDLEMKDRDGRGGYDFAKALEDGAKRKQAERRAKLHDRIGEHAAELQSALRKDLGIKSRVFVP